MTAENGGGAFVIIYILSVILLALPIMAAEILIGKRGKQNPINSLRTLSNEASFYFKNQSDALLNRTTKAKKRFEKLVSLQPQNEEYVNTLQKIRNQIVK